MLLVVVGILLLGSLVFLLTMGVTNNVVNEFTDDVLSDDSFNEVAKTAALGIKTRNSTMWDNAFLILIGGLYLCLFIAGFTLNSHPIMLLLIFVLLIFGGWVGMHIENIYVEMIQDSPELAFETEFPKAHSIMNNIALIAVGGLLLFSIGVFIQNKVGI